MHFLSAAACVASVAVLVTCSTAAADKAIALAFWAVACGLILVLLPQEGVDRPSVVPLFFLPTSLSSRAKTS